MIQTDQQSLKYLLERRVVAPMQQKWLIKLMGCDFVVELKVDWTIRQLMHCRAMMSHVM